MRVSRFLLIASLAANAALAIVWFRGSRPAAQDDTAIPTAASQPPPRDSATATTKSTPGAAAPAGWAALNTRDIPKLVAELRAAGCPPSIIRAIVAERFELRREELTRDGNDAPYWENPRPSPPDPATAAALAALDREARETLLALGGDGESDEARVTRLRRFGNLPAAKIAQVEAIEARRWERVQALQPANPGDVFDSAALEKRAALEQAARAEIATVLTSEEMQEYELRNGSTSASLRAALVGFRATENEFRTLFALQKAHDAEFLPSFRQPSPEEMAARVAGQRKLDEQIRATMSAERFAEYQQASRPEHRELNMLVTRLGLPLSVAAQAAAVQQDIQQRANMLRANRQLSAEGRAAGLVALVDDATTRITAVLGPRGAEGYKQYGGQWLQRLQPQPARPNAKQ